MWGQFILFYVFVTTHLCFCQEYSSKLNRYDNDIVGEFTSDSDVGLNVLQLIEKYGYPLERHSGIQTDDGYILEMHRIPYGKDGIRNKTRPAVLLTHCLLCSSAEFIYFGPKRSLGFILADSGYDVWLANSRGNTWSRHHNTLDPSKDEAFWDFTFHELGMYDNPAMIDYILSRTGEEQLFLIGHSEGTVSTFVTLSQRPEYNSKIKLFTAFAPACYIRDSSFMNALSGYMWPLVKPVLSVLGVNELLPKGNLLPAIANIFCQEYSFTLPLCLEFMFLIIGKNPKFDRKSIPIILSSTPAGSSRKQLEHFIQSSQSGIFQQFDYGEAENLEVYNSTKPPTYNLKNVVVPIAAFYGNGDGILPPRGVEALLKDLPNVIMSEMMKDENWNHLDFLWAIDAPHVLYKTVLKTMENY